jgi:hypothetical protein
MMNAHRRWLLFQTMIAPILLMGFEPMTKIFVKNAGDGYFWPRRSTKFQSQT